LHHFFDDRRRGAFSIHQMDIHWMNRSDDYERLRGSFELSSGN
jgi:hypothetical protein